jgi:hypothetical protein
MILGESGFTGWKTCGIKLVDHALEKAKIRNVLFTPLDEVERDAL